MTTKQEYKLSMYETVLELFSNNPAIVALILAFANAATTFNNKVVLLQAQVALQTAIITGVATAKKNTQDCPHQPDALHPRCTPCLC